MKKLLSALVLILISSLFNKPLYANEKILKLLKEGGKIVFIRHAYAPGNGDPNNFDIKNCSTQRNLNNNGILQSKNIGTFFSKNNIQIDKVLSSEWCRCKDTAKIAFGNYETKNFLNSFYDERFSENKDKQILDFQKFIGNWNKTGNLVLVTHYVVIFEILNLTTSSGEIVITDSNLKFLSSLEIN